ncbi:MAG: hypothetical protein OEV31_01650 [Gammaproteobacteria bacterium]|nr:hypothetical protein [Gammaproteobacteria bacterium]
MRILIKAGFFLLLLACFKAQADWQLQTRTDPVTDRVTKIASVTNGSAEFQIYEHSQRAVAMLRLAGKVTLAESSSIVVRVDKQPPRTLKVGAVDAQRVYLAIDVPLMDEMMAGSELRVQYPINAFENKVELFTLRGSKLIVRQAFDVYPPPVAPEKVMTGAISPAPSQGRRTDDSSLECRSDWTARANAGRYPKLWQGW